MPKVSWTQLVRFYPFSINIMDCHIKVKDINSIAQNCISIKNIIQINRTIFVFYLNEKANLSNQETQIIFMLIAGA